MTVKLKESFLIFMDHDFEHAKNMKLLLCVFEQTKAKYFILEKPNSTKQSILNCTACDLGMFAFRFLGVPMHYQKLRNLKWGAIYRNPTNYIFIRIEKLQ